MKQSNILLGIGIIVAVIIIAASFFLKAEPLEHQISTKKINPVAAVSQSAKNIALVPIKILSRHIIKIH